MLLLRNVIRYLTYTCEGYRQICTARYRLFECITSYASNPQECPRPTHPTLCFIYATSVADFGLSDAKLFPSAGIMTFDIRGIV